MSLLQMENLYHLLTINNSEGKYIVLKIKKKKLFIYVSPKIGVGTPRVYHT